jgi:hypothetical protein
MEALLVLMVCIWRKYPGSIIMGESGGSESVYCGRFIGVQGYGNYGLTYTEHWPTTDS